MDKGWKLKKLGEVAVVSSGNSAPQKKELFENGIFPFIRTSDVGQIKKGFINSCADYLNKDGIKGMKLHKKGTILFPKSGASTFLNHRVMMQIDGYVSSHLATIKSDDLIIDDKFLLYFLMTIDARNLIQDVPYPSLKISDISSISILLPNLSEQQHIVTILDETFLQTQKLETTYKKQLSDSEELKKSILQKAFAGELK
jgi:type I restriction enzyme S subunit